MVMIIWGVSQFLQYAKSKIVPNSHAKEMMVINLLETGRFLRTSKYHDFLALLMDNFLVSNGLNYKQDKYFFLRRTSHFPHFLALWTSNFYIWISSTAYSKQWYRSISYSKMPNCDSSFLNITYLSLAQYLYSDASINRFCEQFVSFN